MNVWILLVKIVIILLEVEGGPVETETETVLAGVYSSKARAELGWKQWSKDYPDQSMRASYGIEQVMIDQSLWEAGQLKDTEVNWQSPVKGGL